MLHLVRHPLRLAYLLLGLWAAAHAPKGESTFSGKVVRVSDGDTIKVESQGVTYTVRLAAIDAPETAQPHGEDARRALSTRVLDKRVEVRQIARDRYRRAIAFVECDKINVNLRMVEDGHAWHYDAYDDDPAFEAAEKKAKQDRLGLWKAASPKAPWDYRREKRRRR